MLAPDDRSPNLGLAFGLALVLWGLLALLAWGLYAVMT